MSVGRTTARGDSTRFATAGIVVIAASAGGVRALMTLVRGLPHTFPLPIVVVLHRPPDRRSHLVDVLARCSALPVIDADGGGSLRGGTIHVARPDEHLTITASRRFAYVDGRRIRFVRSSADPLFKSSAAAFGAGVVAVVLTGSGADGSEGVQTIKAHGGYVIAQDQRTAEHFGMPAAAIATGAVDAVLPLDEIAPALFELATSRSMAAAT